MRQYVLISSESLTTVVYIEMRVVQKKVIDLGYDRGDLAAANRQPETWISESSDQFMVW